MKFLIAPMVSKKLRLVFAIFMKNALKYYTNILINSSCCGWEGLLGPSHTVRAAPGALSRFSELVVLLYLGLGD